jgi:hypothetical protein
MCQQCYRQSRAYAEVSDHARNTVNKAPKRAVEPPKYKSNGKMPLRKKKTSVTDKWLQEFFGFKSQVEMFEEIIASRPHVCAYTNENLNGYLSSNKRYNCCAHVLPKGKYPLFKLNQWNVQLVHPEFHRIVDQGTKKEREQHPLWDFALWDRGVEAQKKTYALFKKEYLL